MIYCRLEQSARTEDVRLLITPPALVSLFELFEPLRIILLDFRFGKV